MTPALPRPFALAPLEEALGMVPGGPPSEAASRLCVNTRFVYRLRERGLNDWQADKLAIRAGLHPGSVWPDWWTTGIAGGPMD